jgi:20S proteasome alpha/beta subunit
MTNEIKTGTTCIGFLFKGGVIVAADRRITTYKIESDNFTKLFDISKNVVSTIAGHVSAAQLFLRNLKSEVKLLELKKEREVKVMEVASILNSYQLGARESGAVLASIMGGYDEKGGVSLFELSPDGSMLNCEPYVSNGSGSIFVKSVLDTQYKSNMTEKESLDLLEKCYKVAFKNDSASGGGYIAKIVTKDGINEVERKIVKTELVNE